MEAYKIDDKIHVFLTDGDMVNDKEEASAANVYKDSSFLTTTEEDKWDPDGSGIPMGTLHTSMVWPIQSYKAKRTKGDDKVSVTLSAIDQSTPEESAS